MQKQIYLKPLGANYKKIRLCLMLAIFKMYNKIYQMW